MSGAKTATLLVMGLITFSIKLIATPPVAEPSREFPALRLEASPDDLEALDCLYDEGQTALLEKLNRCDRDRLASLERLVLPDRWDRDELELSPLPEDSAWAERFPKAIVVHQRLQAFGAYECGRLVRWGPVSSGAERSPTPRGMFFLNWKSKGHRSTVNRDWFLRWYFNFNNKSGHSFHEYELPGRPASHGCVRLLSRDAKWIYDWGDSWALDERGWTVEQPGTPVLVLSKYDFDRVAPWRDPLLFGAEAPEEPAIVQHALTPTAEQNEEQPLDESPVE